MPPPPASGDLNSHPELSGWSVMSVMRIIVLQLCTKFEVRTSRSGDMADYRWSWPLTFRRLNRSRSPVSRAGISSFPANTIQYNIITGRMPDKRQLPVLFYSRGRKSVFSYTGATRYTDLYEIWHDRAARWSAWPCEISSQSVRGPKGWKFPLFGKDSLRRGDPLTHF